MPIYVYETIPSDPKAEPVQFEVKHGMNDKPLETHPETGEPVRRIMATAAVTGVSGGPNSPKFPARPCGPRCGCH